jgi:apolipoprotein D and lipocalin family protein
MTHRLRATVQPLQTLCVVALCVFLAACASRGKIDSAVQGAPTPPLGALMGDWYVVAHVPWFGERGRVGSRYLLAAREDGAISVTRTWRDGFAEPLQSETSIARRDGTSGRMWKLRAYRVVPTRLRLLEAADDGSWMLLDSPGRDYAWILTRARQVEDEAYLELERRMRGNGVNTDKLRRVPQLPEQEGRLGFEPAAVPTPRR